jgi:hypothetical protein
MSHLALLKHETQAIKNPPPTFQTVSGRVILGSCVSFCNLAYFALLASAAGPTGHALSSKEEG